VDERPLDLVREATHRHFARPGDPRRDGPLEGDRQERQRLRPRERARAVRLAEVRRGPASSFDGEQRARLPFGAAEPFAQVARRGGEPHAEVDPPVDEHAEEAAGLPVDRLERDHRCAQSRVEGEGVERVDAVGERRDLGGQRVAEGRPVERRHEGAAGLVGIGRRRGRRVERRPVGDRGGTRGEAFGGDGLRRVARRKLGAGDLARERHRLVPEARDALRAADVEPPARGAGGVVVWHRCSVPGRADVGFQRPNRPTGREREPARLRVRIRDGDQQPDLCPRYLAGDERVAQCGEGVEPLGDPGEALHLAPGESEPLTRPVGDAREAAGLNAAHAQERAREPTDDEPAEGVLSGETTEPVVEHRPGLPVEAFVGVGRDEECGGHHKLARLWGED
jgi:hypothetical protein